MTYLKDHPEAVSYKDDVLNSLLHIAATYNWIKLAEFLLQSESIDINGANILNVTPLMVAADNLCVETANIIWRSGADITLTNASGKTAAMIAQEKGREDFTFLSSYQPLFDAIEQVNMKVIERSVNGSNVNVITSASGTPLIHCSCLSKDRYNVFEFLVKIGADINSLNRQNMTPIMVATENKAIRQFVKLMDLNADLKNVDKKNRTVLSIASQKKLSILIKVLKSHGAPGAPDALDGKQDLAADSSEKRKHRPGAHRVRKQKNQKDNFYSEQKILLKSKIEEARIEAEEISKKLENKIEIELQTT